MLLFLRACHSEVSLRVVGILVSSIIVAVAFIAFLECILESDRLISSMSPSTVSLSFCAISDFLDRFYLRFFKGVNSLDMILNIINY